MCTLFTPPWWFPLQNYAAMASQNSVISHQISHQITLPPRPSKHRKAAKKGARIDVFTFTLAFIIQPPLATASASFITISSVGRHQLQMTEEIEAPTATSLDDSRYLNDDCDYPEHDYNTLLPLVDLLGNEVDEEVEVQPWSGWYLSLVSTFIFLLQPLILMMGAPQDNSLKQWTAECHSKYLDEMLWLEGQAEFRADSEACSACKD